MPRTTDPHADSATGPIRAGFAAVLDWAFDREPRGPVHRRLSAAVFGVWLAVVLVEIAHHEFWRDEVRALTLALEPASLLGLPATLRDEGHPALWHALLRVAHDLLGTPLVLPIVGALVGVAAAGLLFFCAPLPTWFRAAFLFGGLPMFEYTVMCRNYGIGMLLVFAFCHAVGRQRPRPIAAAASLSLLANTNVFGAMIACGLGAFLLVDVLRCAEVLRPRRKALLGTLVGALVGGGLCFAAWTMLPTAASKILPHGAADAVEQTRAGWLDGLLGFGGSMAPVLGFMAPLTWGIVLLTALASLSLPHLAAAVVLVFLAASWFIHFIHVHAFRQLGMLMVMLIAAPWITAGRSAGRPAGAAIERAARRVLLFGVWPLLLALHGYKGLRAVKEEVELARTSAPELADYLATHGLRDAVLLGEPDYYLDSLPFYADNAIYVAREGRYRRYVSWTRENRADWDLGALLAAARSVQEQRGAPVLLLIGPPVILERTSGAVRHGFGNRFTWTAAQRAEFLAATERLGSFPAQPGRFSGDEAYELYRLR